MKQICGFKQILSETNMANLQQHVLPVPTPSMMIEDAEVCKRNLCFHSVERGGEREQKFS